MSDWDLAEFDSHAQKLDSLVEESEGLKTTADGLADASSQMYGLIVGNFVAPFFSARTEKAVTLVDSLAKAQGRARDAIKETRRTNAEAEALNKDSAEDVGKLVGSAKSDVEGMTR